MIFPCLRISGKRFFANYLKLIGWSEERRLISTQSFSVTFRKKGQMQFAPFNIFNGSCWQKRWKVLFFVNTIWNIKAVFREFGWRGDFLLLTIFMDLYSKITLPLSVYACSHLKTQLGKHILKSDISIFSFPRRLFPVEWRCESAFN
jgi:hypothetical protein